MIVSTPNGVNLYELLFGALFELDDIAFAVVVAVYIVR